MKTRNGTPLTKREEDWIRDLKNLCKRCPKTLWLFNNGTMTVMKYPKDGKSIMGSSGGVDPGYMVELISGVYSEGCDW